MALASQDDYKRRVFWAYVILIAFGFAGIHRVYLGRYFTAVLWFVTGGLCGIGIIYDIFAIPFLARKT